MELATSNTNPTLVERIDVQISFSTSRTQNTRAKHVRYVWSWCSCGAHVWCRSSFSGLIGLGTRGGGQGGHVRLIRHIRHTVIILIIGYSGHTGLRCTVGAGVGRWDTPVWISRGPVGARRSLRDCSTLRSSVGTPLRPVRSCCAERSGTLKLGTGRVRVRVFDACCRGANRTSRTPRPRSGPISHTDAGRDVRQAEGPSGNGRGAYGSSIFCG